MKNGWHGEKEEKWDSDRQPDSIPMFFNIPEEYKNSPMNRVYKDLKFTTPVTAEILMKFRFDMTSNSPDKKILTQNISIENFKDAMKNHEALLSIYDTTMIDSLIGYQLKSNNMAPDFEYALVKSNDSVEYSSMPALNNRILKNGIRTRLTPADMFSYPYDIIFYSAGKPKNILSNILWVLSLSAGIIVLLLLGFIYFIRTILRQKKISEMKNDFINNMTHEFNTPIANISLAYETLRDKGKIMLDEHSNRIVGIIQSETDRLKENVVRILRLSSIERNGIQLNFEKIEVCCLMHGVVDRLDLKIKQKNAELNFHKNQEEVTIIGDRLHLTNAIENVIENALKYSNDKCKIDVEVNSSKSNITLTISDNGIGMSKDELKKIFDKFYRVQHGKIQNDRGFGLGLNYVKYIVEAHGGSISVSSKPGKGSSFKFSLNKNERKDPHIIDGG
jgi:two-component system phosphate regulon sensor histidine kinase PhoR